MSKQTPRDFNVIRTNSANVLGPHLHKLIQVTYRTGEGRKMRTDDLFISKLDDRNVWLDEKMYDELHQVFKPSKTPFSVPLEMIHVIVIDDKIIYPIKRSKKVRKR